MIGSEHLVWGAPYNLTKEDTSKWVFIWTKGISSITEYSFILWESHLNFVSNNNLLKCNLMVVR